MRFLSTPFRSSFNHEIGGDTLVKKQVILSVLLPNQGLGAGRVVLGTYVGKDRTATGTDKDVFGLFSSRAYIVILLRSTRVEMRKMTVLSTIMEHKQILPHYARNKGA